MSPKTTDQLVSDYERLRQLVRDLAKEKIALIEQCEGIIDFPLSETCLKKAWDEYTSSDNWGAYGDGPGYQYEEIINNEAENEDEYCTFCQQAYALKLGPIAQAKKDLGNAKRALSRRGKLLLKKATP